MKGFIYRTAIRIKDYGERFGRIPILGLLAVPIIGLGLAIKSWALNQTAEGF
ncbi:hypothetical protein AGMMS4952_11040 [Spirochaetia bacterium]|nr:hypothetical protein AGMMS4952_11040 [Spirochaetia bacterium]